MLKMIIGINQGGCLGPLLFDIFINDIANKLERNIGTCSIPSLETCMMHYAFCTNTDSK